MGSRGILCQHVQSFLNMLLDLQLARPLKNQRRWSEGKTVRLSCFSLRCTQVIVLWLNHYCEAMRRWASTSVSSQQLQLIARCPHILRNIHRFVSDHWGARSKKSKCSSKIWLHLIIVYTIANQTKAFLRLLSKGNYIFTRKESEMLHVFGGAKRPRGW